MLIPNLTPEEELYYFAKKFPQDHERLQNLEDNISKILHGISSLESLKEKVNEIYEQMFVEKDDDKPCVIGRIRILEEKKDDDKKSISSRLAIIYSIASSVIVGVALLVISKHI